jgi:EAL domain-containing protein (putative c-di-GMP-specific phosphodiesterase class I)
LRRACQEAGNWPADIKVAVNLSSLQLKNKNFVELVMNVLANSGLPADRLQLEITETVLMQNTFNTLATLKRLRALGVQIALDDFGTGYSSLSYLRSFPFDKFKIDRSFVQDLSNSKEPIAIVHAVAGLAKSLNMVSTAEGVETKQQRDALQSLGCVEMKGYLFSRPRPPAEIAEILFQSRGAADASPIRLSSDN